MTNTNVLNTALQAKYKAIEATFLPEWTTNQFQAIKKAISNYFYCKPISTNKGIFTTYSFKQLADILGLAYTSTSSYAGYWICNVELKHNTYTDYHYIGFALSTDNKAYAILWDKDENEIIIPL